MTNDPSSIPSFGGQPGDPDQPDGGGGWSAVVVPDLALVQEILDQLELRHVVDEDGDVLAPWEDYRLYFMFRGERQELYAVRAFYDRPFPIERKPALLEVIDEWNRITLWPKVYTHTDDEGVVHLIGEAQMVVDSGVTLEYFVSTTAGWVQAAAEFENWLVERLDLEDEANGDD